MLLFNNVGFIAKCGKSRGLDNMNGSGCTGCHCVYGCRDEAWTQIEGGHMGIRILG